MKTGASGPEQHRGNAGRAEDGGVGPEGHSQQPRSTAGRLRGFHQQGRQRVIGVDLVRLAAEENRGFTLELGIVGAQPAEDGFSFRNGDIGGLAREGAPFELQPRVDGIGTQFVPAFDCGGVQRPETQPWMLRAVLQLSIERLEGDQDAAHTEDGVPPVLRPAAVGRAPAGADGHPLKALVRDPDVEAGRFGDDGSVRPAARHQRIGPHARMLFVHDRCDQQ